MPTILEQLQEMNSHGKIKPADSIHIGSVVGIQNDNELMNVKEFRLPYSARASHFGCLGTTRIGKTKLLTHMITQDIRAGNNVVLTDPKGDDQCMSAVIQAAVEAGRLDDIMLITPIYPDCSLMVDPLAYYYLMDELVDHVVSGIKSDDQYFVNVAAEVTTAVVSALIAQDMADGRKSKINFMDIKSRIDYVSLTGVRDSLQYLENHSNQAVRELVAETQLNLRQILGSPPDFFAKVSSSLRTVLTSLTSSTTGKIIGRATTNEFVKRFENGQGVILIVNTGSLLARRSAYIIGRVLISMIQSMVGRFFASGSRLKKPLCMYLDEGHNILYQGIQELFNKSGGAGVWLHFFTQSMAQIEEVVGIPTMQSIMDNISTWVYMKVNYNDTAQYIEESSPLTTIWKRVPNIGDGKISVSMHEKEEHVIRADKVLKLKKQYFYLRSGGHFYKGRVPDVPDPYMRIKFPKISTAGMADENNEQNVGAIPLPLGVGAAQPVV